MNTPNPAPGFKKHPDHKMQLSGNDFAASAAVGGIIIARTTNAIIISEGDYADAIYFPRADVDIALLQASETTSFCPFKGTAHYWHLRNEQQNTPEHIDICWRYEEPFDEAINIGTYIAFYRDKVTVTYCQ